MSSELEYGISAQPPDTCPAINEAQSAIEEAIGYTERHEGESEDDLRERLSQINYILGQVVGYRKLGLLEDIRENVTAARGWGQEWKDLAKDHAPILEAQP